MQLFLDQFDCHEIFSQEAGQYGLPISPEPPGAPEETYGAGIRPQLLRSCRTGG